MALGYVVIDSNGLGRYLPRYILGYRYIVQLEAVQLEPGRRGEARPREPWNRAHRPAGAKQPYKLPNAAGCIRGPSVRPRIGKRHLPCSPCFCRACLCGCASLCKDDGMPVLWYSVVTVPQLQPHHLGTRHLSTCTLLVSRVLSISLLSRSSCWRSIRTVSLGRSRSVMVLWWS